MGLHLNDVGTILVIIGLLISGLRWAHGWVGKREADSEGLHGIRKMINEANERSSDKHSETMKRIYALEEAVTRLKALEEARHFHARKDDSGF